MEPATLEARQLTKTFGEGETLTQALDAVSLELHRGQVTLVMGPSGCGKTTLLAVLAGLLHPDSGRVLALGHDLYDMSDVQRRQFRLNNCGFIFQGFNLFPTLTVREQLEMVLRWGQGASLREARRETASVLDLLGLSRKGKYLPRQLSGGEQQRVAIGRALIKRPSFFFADEPTSALDWEHGRQVVELLRQAARDHGSTVFIVSHDPRVLAFADQVIYLEDGRVKKAPAHNPS